ncbi:solute carrier family 25 member 45 isoform X2 [Uranotaenia lowii]|uniref:solute carrier family 25 member 45 isoform X2 n=1 Tax=Uranotaenia lowii TaxID=190385 RepID=UPI0024790B1A|nr:solute carrier family 25 member 45 isoform X2 [Uranotaenia lowii]
MLFPFLTGGALNSVAFSIYGSEIRHLQAQCKTQEEKQRLWRKHVFIAGSLAGASQVFLGCPVEVVKVRLQTLRCHPWLCLHDIVVNEGIRGMYRGITPLMCRDVVPYGIYMLVYEYILGIEERLHRLKRDNKRGVGNRYEASLIGTAGAVAGVVSWIIIVPFDVVKTVMQTETSTTNQPSMMESFRYLVRTHGWRSLFRGSSMIIARAVPVNSATFLGYEWFLGKCHEHFEVDYT